MIDCLSGRRKPMSGRSRRYLALFFPWLPAERWRAAAMADGAAPADAPLAFVERARGAMRLTAVDPAAAALGLGPGLAMADARARVPDLALCDADPRADFAWLERLADGCARYTPTVALDPPGGVILDTAGCDHLFGGEAALAADLERRLAQRGLVARHAYAATPEAARALARHGAAPGKDEAAAIRRLPVAALELEEDGLLALRRAGLKTIGDLARLPLASVAARFGEDAVMTLRQILGEADSALAPRRAQTPVRVERRFAEPIARTETALSVLAELAEEAATELEARKLGGRRFEAAFFRSDGDVRRLGIETGAPNRDVAALNRLWRERIDTLSDPIDPGFGFDLIQLCVASAEPLAATQLALEGGALAETEVIALVERLSARLGRGRVRRLAPRDSHIPEQAEFALPALDAPPQNAPLGLWPQPEPGEPPLRPIHLFDPPQPIEVLSAEVPDGPPRRFRWRRGLHDVARFEGPERIAAEWWRRRPAAYDAPRVGGDADEFVTRHDLGDDPDTTRDYYRVEDRRGRRFWIFRRGFFEAEKPMPRWYLHGLFA